MVISKVDGTKLKQAVAQFGSLQDAIQHLQKGKLILEKQNAGLKQESERLILTRDKLSHEIKDMSNKINSYKIDLQSLFERIGKHSRQYELFCSFMAMVADSPSINNSLRNVIALFQKLLDTGWCLSKSAEDMRNLFVRTILGDYLKCFCCDYCGAKFIVNKVPKHRYYGTSYECPVCHLCYGVKEDDSFLEAMVSAEQLKNIHRVEEVLKENEMLASFKVFIGAACEICGKPINEWKTQNIKLAIQGIGLGHSVCWNSEVGRLIELRRAIEKTRVK